jgi:hypothetical protein
VVESATSLRFSCCATSCLRFTASMAGRGSGPPIGRCWRLFREFCPVALAQENELVALAWTAVTGLMRSSRRFSSPAPPTTYGYPRAA